MKKAIAICIATGLYSGFLRPYAGTWGTIPAWLIGFFLLRGDPLLLSIAIVVTTAVSVWSAGEAEKLFGHDARKIVIDEWAGMFVTFFLLPFSLGSYIVAFFAFRLFDVVKIPPASQLERLPGGWGVTMDDIAAGVFANVAVQLIVHFYPEILNFSL